MVDKKYLCSKHFTESDFGTSQRIQWKKSGSSMWLRLSFHIQPGQSFKPLLLIPSSNSLPSFLKPEDNLYILPHTRTYSKMPVSSFNKTSIPICAKCSTFSQISVEQTPPIAVTACQWMEPQFPQNPVNLYPTQDMLVPKLLLKT